MDAGGLNQLVEYGILGLWTLSLLVSNHTMRGNFQKRYDDLNKNVVDVAPSGNEKHPEHLIREYIMKYIYGSILFLSIDLIVLYSRTVELFLSSQDVLLLGTINTFLWIYYEKFWKTYEKYQKELDK